MLQIKDGPRTGEQRFDLKAFRTLGRRNVVAIAAMGCIIFFIIGGINQIINPYMENEFGISLSQAGTLTTVWGIGILIGSVFGGKIYDAIGKKQSIYIGIALSIFSLVGLAYIPTLWLAWVFMFIFGFSYGTYQTIYFALAMHITETAIAASMFAILMSITNIGQAVGMGVTGFAVMPEALGYRTTLLVFAALNFLLLPLMRPAFRSPQKA